MVLHDGICPGGRPQGRSLPGTEPHGLARSTASRILVTSARSPTGAVGEPNSDVTGPSPRRSETPEAIDRHPPPVDGIRDPETEGPLALDEWRPPPHPHDTQPS